MSWLSFVPLSRRRRLKSNRAFARYVAISPGARVVAVASGLVIAAAGVMVLDAAGAPSNHRRCAEQFQRMAGGLGLGATVCPRWCFDD